MHKKYKQFFDQKKKEYSCGNGKFIVEKIENLNNKLVYLFIKRAFDLTFSFVGLIITFIPMIVISIFIKVDSKGPVFFTQERLGKDGKAFIMFKFRSMVQDAEKSGPQWADKDDNRVTRVGNVLRKTRLDEIPQLINIFLGQMSFVGPRPERKVFYEEFKNYIDGFDQRLIVTPGLTGIAQVNGGYELKPEEKIIFDIEYIKKRTLIIDLLLILKTIKIVFNQKGAR